MQTVYKEKQCPADPTDKCSPGAERSMTSIPRRTFLGQALVPTPTLPSLTDWGWIKTSGVYEPLWTKLSEASKIYQDLVSCKCKEGCVKKCKCKKARPSTPLCACDGECSQNWTRALKVKILNQGDHSFMKINFRDFSMTFQDQPKQISMTYRHYIFPEINETLHMNHTRIGSSSSEAVRLLGSWVLGEGAPSSEPPPHQLGGLGERSKLPQRGSGRSPGRKRILDVEDPIKRIWWWQISQCSCKNFTTLCVNFPWPFHGFSMTFQAQWSPCWTLPDSEQRTYWIMQLKLMC